MKQWALTTQRMQNIVLMHPTFPGEAEVYHQTLLLQSSHIFKSLMDLGSHQAPSTKYLYLGSSLSW
ncbi:hypothetical protein FRX31_021460 [Thalictrum thalictroides]|uniref:Uncharacterized protein n=1 Tax=Thalictrum thalictroides TaxID=46969 RepID=A0A7J6VV36_THATH|nr:hypothetical protein FRX31_021460 [Thalictrum thalictroides]